jgi:hypothetical protein
VAEASSKVPFFLFMNPVLLSHPSTRGLNREEQVIVHPMAGQQAVPRYILCPQFGGEIEFLGMKTD